MKQAFLMMAHNNFSVVQVFLRMLDSEDSGFYIHINRKVDSFPRETLERCVKKGKLVFTDRLPVGYCNYSMVEAVKVLLKTAARDSYDYYHIVSCSDLPLKTPKEMAAFLNAHNGAEFVGFSRHFTAASVEQAHYFTALCRHSNETVAKWALRLHKGLVLTQRAFGINRMRKCPWEIKKGCDWYSVTHDAALYLLEKEPEFKRYFYRAYCPTEFFAQTILFNSEFRQRLYNTEEEAIGSQRYIDWDRGSPYVFQEEDFKQLISADSLFARKFIEMADMEVVKKLEHYLTSGK